MLYVYDNEVVAEPKIKGGPKETHLQVPTPLKPAQYTIIIKTEMKRQS